MSEGQEETKVGTHSVKLGTLTTATASKAAKELQDKMAFELGGEGLFENRI